MGWETRIPPKGMSRVSTGEGVVAGLGRCGLERLGRRRLSGGWGGVLPTMVVDVVMRLFLSDIGLSTWVYRRGLKK